MNDWQKVRDYARAHGLYFEMSMPVNQVFDDPPYMLGRHEYTGEIFVTIGDKKYAANCPGGLQYAQYHVLQYILKDLGIE